VAENKKELARQLFELGIEEYKAKSYHDAALSMEKSYALDDQPSTLYALAQSQRLDNNCKEAVVNYKKLLEKSDEANIKKAVEKNLELCAQIERGEKPKEDEKHDDKLDAPIIQTRTVYRTEKTNDKVAIAAFVGGGIAVSGAVAFFLVGRSARSDADHSTSLAEYNDLYDRSITMRNLSIASAGVGLILFGIGTYRVLNGGKKQEESSVAVIPTNGGSFVSWSGHF